MKRIYTLSKTMAFLFSCMALIGTASSCADDYNTDPLTKNTILSSITIDEKYEVYTLVKGENYTLHFSTLPEDATNPGVSWVSSKRKLYRRNLVSIFYRGKVAMRKWLRLMKTGEYWLWEKEKRQLLQQLQMARICPIQLR